MATVLHIEDDANSRRLVEKLLTAAGHRVIETASGLEGIRLASKYRPDLVLVDINIPDLDGYEVTLRLKGTPELHGVPVVAITAEGDRQTSLAVGADGYIGKPIDASSFAEQLGQFLSGRRERPDATGEVRLRERSQKIVERLERKVVELSEANERLEEMARLRREFLQNVTHELATPMTPVVGYLRLFLKGELGQLTPIQRKCLASIDESTTRLRSVIDKLLDVSALETGRMQFQQREYDFNEVAARAIDELQHDGTRQIVGPVDVAMPAIGDSDKLRRAMLSILDNALKFTPAGGRIVTETRVEEGRGERFYTLCVADNGPGVPPDRLSKILEPFYQVDGSPTRRHGGVGLGLAFARRVAEAHGGRLLVRSPPPEPIGGEELAGTEVRLTVAERPMSS